MNEILEILADYKTQMDNVKENLITEKRLPHEILRRQLCLFLLRKRQDLKASDDKEQAWNDMLKTLNETAAYFQRMLPPEEADRAHLTGITTMISDYLERIKSVQQKCRLEQQRLVDEMLVNIHDDAASDKLR